MAQYHFIGIKGAGMSALASILHDLGHSVKGSDVEHYFFTQTQLEKRGVELLPFDANNIHADDIIIQGNAFHSGNNVEVRAVLEQGLQAIPYSEYLAEFASSFISVAIAGTHGKTTTTGMLAQMLAPIKPTAFLIGDGTGLAASDSEYFVFEACEYKRHFLAYAPDYAIITNIEFDHPDYFKDEQDVLQAFEEFANQATKKVIVYGDDANALQLGVDERKIIYYGKNNNNDVQARNIKKTQGGVSFDVYVYDEFSGHYQLPFYGDHMIANSLAVITVGILQNIDPEVINEHLAEFTGVQRRFNVREFGNQVLVDDYAHHPTEIAATLEAIRQRYPERELVLVFQPHTFSRTEAFLDEFAEILSKADSCYLVDIFASARETQGALSISDLAAKIPGSKVLSYDNLAELCKHDGAAIVFMGAGDVNEYLDAYQKECANRNF